MSLEFAILGFLNYQPLTGYDLKRIFDSSVRHFWYADQSQIYRTLIQLNKDGLTEIERVEQTERPGKNIFRITEKGRAALHEWLSGPFALQKPHNAPLIQTFFAGMLDNEQILAKFEEAQKIFQMEGKQYAHAGAHIEELINAVNSPREYYFWMLTVDLGIRTMQLQAEWAEKVIQMLKENQLPAE
jgi:DNA-binding PadR family transcriptional regulator